MLFDTYLQLVWTQVAREGLKLLESRKAGLLAPDLLRFWFSSVPRENEPALALGRLLAMRNGLSHEKIKAMLPHEFEDLCGKSFADLGAALEALGFLLDVEMKLFSPIEVLKRRRDKPAFVHRFKTITGTSDDFHGGKEKLDLPMDSGAIVLVRISDRRHLSLDPLYVDEAAAGDAPDVFFYNGMPREGSAEYAACNRGGTFESGRSARGAEIVEEIRHLGLLMGGEPPQGGG